MSACQYWSKGETTFMFSLWTQSNAYIHLFPTGPWAILSPYAFLPSIFIPQPQVHIYLIILPSLLFHSAHQNYPVPCSLFLQCQSILWDSRKLPFRFFLLSTNCYSIFCIPMPWEHWTWISSYSLFRYQMVSSWRIDFAYSFSPKHLLCIVLNMQL